MKDKNQESKPAKGFFSRILDRLDKKMEEKAKSSSCCCKSSDKSGGKSCCN